MGWLLQKLSTVTGLRDADLVRIMTRAPEMYKAFFIPKRNGGLRAIAQPARSVKFVQRALVQILLRELPVHECATAYRDGRSIADNARFHAGNGSIAKFDFESFFTSIRASDWRAYCVQRSINLSSEELSWTEHLLFRRTPGYRELRLAIGAPSSPVLSNALMYDFDEAVIRNQENSFVQYSRYADDMTFSAPRMGYLNYVEKILRRTIKEVERPRLKLNVNKTKYITSKYSRRVTGIVLANDGRVTIGRERKRKLRSALHRAQMDVLSSDELRVVAGMLGFLKAVEPDYLESLRQVHGGDLVDRVMRCADPNQPHSNTVSEWKLGF